MRLNDNITLYIFCLASFAQLCFGFYFFEILGSYYHYFLPWVLTFTALIFLQRWQEIYFPTFVIFSYISLSMFLGCLVLEQGWVQYSRFSTWEPVWKHKNEAGLFFNLSLTIWGLCQLVCYFPCPVKQNYRITSNQTDFIFNLLLLILSLIGFFFIRETNPIYSWIFFIPVSALVIAFISRLNPIWVIIISLAWVIIFSTMFETNKREVIFIFFPIVFIKFYNSNMNFKKTVFPACFFLALAVIAILIMSIFRGYGEFDVEKEFNSDLFFALISYVKMSDFLDEFARNIEVIYFFTNSFNAVQLIMMEEMDIALGRTFIKALFSPLQFEIFTPFKPDSILTEYTKAADYSYRQSGGSLPINIISELFWNFGWLGFFLVPALFLFFRLIELKLWVSFYLESDFIKTAFWGYLTVLCFTLARGSGLDQFAAYSILLIGFAFILNMVAKFFMSFLRFIEK